MLKIGHHGQNDSFNMIDILNKAIIIPEIDFHDAFPGISVVLITCVTDSGKAMVMLLVGHSNNGQMILKLFGYDIFCNNLHHKKFEVNLEVSEVLITHDTNRGRAWVMFVACKDRLWQ